jgi:hypothetical protein
VTLPTSFSPRPFPTRLLVRCEYPLLLRRAIFVFPASLVGSKERDTASGRCPSPMRYADYIPRFRRPRRCLRPLRPRRSATSPMFRRPMRSPPSGFASRHSTRSHFGRTMSRVGERQRPEAVDTCVRCWFSKNEGTGLRQVFKARRYSVPSARSLLRARLTALRLLRRLPLLAGARHERLQHRRRNRRAGRLRSLDPHSRTVRELRGRCHRILLAALSLRQLRNRLEQRRQAGAREERHELRV